MLAIYSTALTESVVMNSGCFRRFNMNCLWPRNVILSTQISHSLSYCRAIVSGKEADSQWCCVARASCSQTFLPRLFVRRFHVTIACTSAAARSPTVPIRFLPVFAHVQVTVVRYGYQIQPGDSDLPVKGKHTLSLASISSHSSTLKVYV